MQRVGRPIPGRYETQSFSLSEQDREKRDVLCYIFLRLPADDLKNCLQRSVSGSWPNPDLINKVYEGLSAAGIVQPHMIAGAKDNSLRHCVRCHKVYKEMENAPTACLYKRAMHMENADGSTSKSHFHQFVARHTTRPETIDYSGNHFVTCEALDCAARGIPSRTPSPTASDWGFDED